MRTNVLSTLILGSAVAVLLSAAPASAQATRTWVSGVGDDVNPCSRTAPCKTFAGAISKTARNGEINCLDPAGYGAVTITKSITIECGWTHGSILASSVTGININITDPADTAKAVRLRGLSINGTGGSSGPRTGLDGIRVSAATAVFVENLVIEDFSQQGIDVAVAANLNLTLDNVIVRGANASGIALTTSSGQVVVSMNNVRVDATPVGIAMVNNVRLNARDLVLSHNTTGIHTNGSNTIVNIDNMMASFHTTGVLGGAGNTVRISNSVITQNSTGLNANGGSIVSMQGNSVTGNTSDGAFTSTVGKL